VAEDVKLCECGCGQPTTIAATTNRSSGTVKGQPHRFIKGHHLKQLAASRRIDWTGQRFGLLTVIGPANARRERWQLKCECGTVLNVDIKKLRMGEPTSCGSCEKLSPKSRPTG
jgi:hypothetical protein